jgi:sulfite oxidase
MMSLKLSSRQLLREIKAIEGRRLVSAMVGPRRLGAQRPRMTTTTTAKTTKQHCALSTLASDTTRQQQQQQQSQNNTSQDDASMLYKMLFAGLMSAGTGSSLVLCEKQKKKLKKAEKDDDNDGQLTPSHVAKEDFDELQASHDIDKMPVYTLDQVAENNGSDGKPIWMSYGGVVYDVTNFIANHPGGSEKILMAAGSAIEPFWHLYRQHFASDLPMRLMEHMAIGRLSDADQSEIDQQMDVLEQDDPYAKEPLRHSALIVHSDTPMNAEVPTRLLTKSYLTPSSLFYIRHHHPVPYLTDKEMRDYRLSVDLSRCGKGARTFTLDDLKAMKSTEVTVTLQCSGNRRSGYNEFQRTSGTPWGQGAISTGKFKGVKLSDLLKAAGLSDPVKESEENNLQHVRFHALDGMMASIGIEKALNPYGDCIIAYEMNDEPLTREHGAPLRIIVPGYAAVRNVKWVQRIEVAETEAEGPWQRGLNYKTLPPNVTDAQGIDLADMPSMTEVSLFSGITKTKRLSSTPVKAGDTVQMHLEGWAWSGGGRNIVRVDITANDGKTWSTAKLTEGVKQKFGRAWAWTFWECDIPAVVQEDGSVHLASKAVDMAFNVQPESSDHSWNVRGLGNNSWYKTKVRVIG